MVQVPSLLAVTATGDMMKEFLSNGEYDIVGRGRVIMVSFAGMEAGEVRALNKDWVMIDGEEYFVKGVETFAVGDDTTIREAGFMVDDS